MSMRKIIDRIRYNPKVSNWGRKIAVPIDKFCGYVRLQLRWKIPINGAVIRFEDVDVIFPPFVGLEWTNALYWDGGGAVEPNVNRILKHFAKRCQQFIDVGSYIGHYSVLARKWNPEIAVHSFEPIPVIYEKNCLFHKANNMDITHIKNVACSDQEGMAEIYLPLKKHPVERETTGASLRKGSWQQQSDDKQVITVQTIKLDSFFMDFEIQNPLLIKIDVEDFEAAVLRGAESIIRKNRPIIVTEILPRDHGNQETWDILHDCNYVLFAICADGLFRFQKEDFFRKRGITDFLCLHASLISEEQYYISYRELNEIAVDHYRIVKQVDL